MPKQNRVTPFGALIATEARGTFMGNRGCLHDANGVIKRPFATKTWIICALEFEVRGIPQKQPLMDPGCNTQLFFLDEATALAAGHRPCWRCRRERFNAFKEAWMRGNAEAVALAPDEKALSIIDAPLHAERRIVTAAERRDSERCETPAILASLPPGAFVADGAGNAYLSYEKALWLWRSEGYERLERPPSFPLEILTPPSVIRALAAGYEPAIHASAKTARSER